MEKQKKRTGSSDRVLFFPFFCSREVSRGRTYVREKFFVPVSPVHE